MLLPKTFMIIMIFLMPDNDLAKNSFEAVPLKVNSSKDRQTPRLIYFIFLLKPFVDVDHILFYDLVDSSER